MAIKNFLYFFFSFFKIVFFTFVFILIIDFFFGNLILKITDNIWKKTNFYERLFRIDHPVYHHTLKENITHNKALGIAGYYTLCTNENGFRISCKPNANTKTNYNYDYVFIGDSFTEGVSLDYEDSFVGIIDKELKPKKIANLGVVSYGTKIYLSKINYYLNNGLKFDHLIVGIDISDLYNDDVFYKINNDLIVTENFAKEKKLKIRKFLRKNFPFTNFYMYVFKKYGKYEIVDQETDQKIPKIGDKANLVASWTYLKKDDQVEGYVSSTNIAQINMIKTMEQLYEILKKNKIKLSVLIYPWPQQLEKDNENSIHVKMWEDFCKLKCEHFINLFPVFFDELKDNSFLNTYKKYYFWNDVHFNKNGNKLLAEEILKVIN